MLITKEWLKEKSACNEGYEWSLKQNGFEDGIEVIKFLNMLVEDGHWDWANWVIVRAMTRPQCLAYAIFSSEQVIDIFEKKYPKDDSPRKAIEAAKRVLENDTEENRAAAGAAAAAAYAAAATAAAAYAVAAASYAAAATAYAAASADTAEKDSMRKKILDYGIELLTSAEGGGKEYEFTRKKCCNRRRLE